MALVESASLEVQEGFPMEEMDWDKGLPPDVLALVAKAGGLELMKDMRGVSKTWQQGFELGVTHIKVHFRDPMLPSGAQEAAQRFPALTSLDVGESAADEGWLQNLRDFPKLRTLILGYHARTFMIAGNIPDTSFACRLTGAGLEALAGLSITSLNLASCMGVRTEALEHIRGLPLTQLSLEWCPWVSSDARVETLRGLPVTHIFIAQEDEEYGGNANDALGRLTTDCLVELEKMPLESVFFGNATWLSDAGLSRLRRLPLTSLEICFCNGDAISDQGLEALKEMPLTNLTLLGSAWLTDSGLGAVQKLPLTSLSLFGSPELTDQGLRHLAHMPLTTLDLGHCPRLTDGSLLLLEEYRTQGMPLAYLNVEECEELSAAAQEGVAALQEAWHQANPMDDDDEVEANAP